MSALTSALNSIESKKAKEIAKAAEMRQQVLRAIVREAQGVTDDSDVIAIKKALETKLFTTSELHELIAMAVALAEGESADRQIESASHEANLAGEHYQMFLKQHREAEKVAAEAALDARNTVAELQHKRSCMVQIKKSHPELYAEWSLSSKDLEPNARSTDQAKA